MKQLKLEVIFGAKNKLSPALKLIVGSSNAASKALKKTNDQLKDLERQQSKIATFRKLKEDVKQATAELDKTNRKIAVLKQSLSVSPNAQLSAELKKTEAEARRLNKVVTEGKPKLMALRQELNQAGLKSTNLAQHQEKLKNQIHGTNTEIDKQKKHLQNLNRVQQNTQKMSGHVRNAGLYGAGAAATGVTAMYQLRKPIDETKRMDITENRIGALGLGNDASKEATQFSRSLKTYGTSILDNTNLMLDATTAFADVHHAKMVTPTLAKMKFANEAMFGAEQGAENENKFMNMLKVIELRNGLRSEEAFKEQANKVQRVITATGGRVGPDEWLNAIKTGGVAVKGLTDEAFYYKMEPVVQELSGNRFGTAAMSAYQNIYQGRTTKRAANNMERLGLIADPSKLKHDKAGQISFLDVGAIKGAELFKKDQFAWMEEVLLPALAKKGITKPGQVHDAMGSIFTNRTASNLFTTMYDQREQIHKNMKLNAGAEGIDQLSERAKTTTAGKELEAKANLHDAYLKFGTTILPIYTKAIETATGALQTFNGWMERNPTLAKILGVGLMGIAASLIAIGGTLAVFSPLILGMLSLRLMMATLGPSTGALGLAFRLLKAPMALLRFDLLGLAKNFMFVSRLFLTNPIVLAVAAIAAVAFLVYKNWEPIKGFFVGIWSTIKTAFNGGIKGVSALIINWSPIGLFYMAFAKVLSWFGIDLPSKFTGFGGMIIDGLIKGIKAGFEKLKGLWATINSYMPSFMQRSMDIHSPSRVMAGLGGHIMGGLRLGLHQGFPELKTKFADVLGIFSPNVNGLIQKINVAPALSKIKNTHALPSGSNRGDIVIQGDTITMHIHTQPGQSVQQIAQVVNQMLSQREHQKLARARNSFMDNE